MTQPNPPAFAHLSPKKRILPDWFFEAPYADEEEEEDKASKLSQALCADARERIEAALDGLRGNEEEPTLDEVLADLFEDVDDELRARLLCPLYDAWCTATKEVVVPYDRFVFRCTYDLVFALHALEAV